LGVEGEEGGFEVLLELGKDLLGGGNISIGHTVVPHLREGNSSSLTHLVEGCHDLDVVCSINCGVKDEVGLYGLDPSHGFGWFSREVGRESYLKFDGLGGHGSGWEVELEVQEVQCVLVERRIFCRIAMVWGFEAQG
jgi:hypothetical protein